MRERRRVVVTGATGFVGRRVLPRLHDLELVAAGRTRPELPVATYIKWDAESTPFPAELLSAGDVVLHMAAATGTASASTMRQVNEMAVSALVQAARCRRVQHLIFVSSIAAGFRDVRWYAYALAKRASERVVLSAEIPATVVRPTMILGPGSPVLAGLRRLACAPLPVVLGRGEARVQPVHVEDVADLLAGLCAAPPEPGQVIEVGGPETLTMTDLIARLRAAQRMPPARVRRIPVGALRPALAMCERLLPVHLPITAGQLASFVNDGVARPNDVVRRHLPHLRPLSEMLAVDDR